jgi:mRNA-degrading endonuclease YafQ of YafQ-DinJ toxin-antitoxin module
MLFRKDGNAWNACVGNNGLQDDWKYADGYSKNCEAIMQKLIEAKRIDLDILVYPLVFSARHSIELFLKETIRKINRLRRIYNEDELNIFIQKTHSLKSIWNKYVEISIKTDRRFIYYRNRLSIYVDEFEKIDLEGQTFRYSSNVKGLKNLVNQSTIDIVNFYKEYRKVWDVLESIRSRYYELKEEYNIQTITNNLSRRDIRLISLELPKYSKWKNKELFIKNKRKLKEKYNISYTELD